MRCCEDAEDCRVYPATCSCDAECRLYGDCCSDIDSVCPKEIITGTQAVVFTVLEDAVSIIYPHSWCIIRSSSTKNHPGC